MYTLLEHSFWSREQDVERGVCMFTKLIITRHLFDIIPAGAVTPAPCCANQSSHRTLECPRRVWPVGQGSLYVSAIYIYIHC